MGTEQAQVGSAADKALGYDCYDIHYLESTGKGLTRQSMTSSEVGALRS